VRTFERGERVHTAMLARGYDGRMPALQLAPAASPVAWIGAAIVPALAIAVLVAARGWLA
jgi:cobalt/nickel transport system permease protein